METVKTERKTYRHRESGAVWNGGSVVVVRGGKSFKVFNPSEELLKEAGFEVYEAPAVVVSEEEQLRLEMRRRMREIEAELRGMDYLTSKALDGEDMSAYDERYGGDWREYRKGLRREYRELEASLTTETTETT